ncbi:MAG: hypothetical protein DRZ82_00025 [Thermoprotei archaeon]|nr:MAG: hypothetical protein DRZ82_00025 [Thermoprotei archaeon]
MLALCQYYTAREIMVRSKYVVFLKPHVVKIMEEELPKPQGNEVLIRTKLTLISAGTELTALTGNFPPGSRWANYVRYPFRPGYCNVGIVEEVGGDVKEINVGDVVVSTAHHSQYALMSSDNVIKVPGGVHLEEAVFHTIAAGVMHSVRISGVTLGTSVVVIGLGILGQMAVQFSRLCGAYPVIGIDLYEKRLEIGKKSGATHIVNARTEDVHEEVRRITEGNMADIVFEVTGSPDVIPWAIKLVRPMGRLIILSSPRGPTTLDFHDEVNAPSRIIQGTHFSSQPEVETYYYPWTRRRNTKLFLKMLADGIVKVRHLITHIIPFERANEAYELLLKRKEETLAVLLDFRKKS